MKNIKNNLLILLLIFFSANIYCQKKSKEAKIFENSNCARLKNISFKNRLKMFPFENTTQIIVVSHRTKEGTIGEALKKYLRAIKINQDTFNPKEFEQSERLNFKQIERFTDIIFNYNP